LEEKKNCRLLINGVRGLISRPLVLTKRQMARRRKDGRVVNGVLLPPMIQTSIHLLRRTTRFVSTSASATSIQVRGLLASLGCVCYTVNAAMRTLFSSVRLLKVEIWTEPTNASADNSSLVWVPTNVNEPDFEYVDANMGTSLVGHQIHVPPKDSKSAWWHNTASETDVIFSISCPIFSVIDVTVEATSSNNENGSAVAIATGIVGNIYYGALDAASTHRYPPTGLPTTF
jgi:hypothetical protein